MIDYVELKKLAEAANQSMPDWERDVMCESDLSTVGLDYAAAMSPVVTLRLLEIIEYSKKAIARIEPRDLAKMYLHHIGKLERGETID